MVIFFNGTPLEYLFGTPLAEADAAAPVRIRNWLGQTVTKRLAETGQTFPFLPAMLRQILSRGL